MSFRARVFRTRVFRARVRDPTKVARHNAHCLVRTAYPTKIRPFKSMVKLLHTRTFKQPVLVG